MKTATFLIAAILVMAPSYAQAAPSTDAERIAVLKTQIEMLQIQLAKLSVEAPIIQKEAKSEVKKEKKLKAKTLKTMDDKVAALDAEWKAYVGQRKFVEGDISTNKKSYWIVGTSSIPASSKDIETYKIYVAKKTSLLGK